jgi:hypothetical protein
MSLPGGCQIDFVDHTARHQLNRVMTHNNNQPTLRAGTDWELLYTDSSGNSSGKIGPVLGRVTQVFARAEEGAPPGTYKNVVSFGPAVIKLSALAVGLYELHPVYPYSLKPPGSNP